MSEFEDSRWASPEFSQEYRESADSYIPGRYRMIGVLASLYVHFLGQNQGQDRGARVLDLGCGDGLIVQELLKVDGRIQPTLLDGSPEMLAKAKERLAGFGQACFVRAGFQDLLVRDPFNASFDLILSSFAIHHLVMDQKRALFEYAYAHLNPGGFFVNMDVVLAPDQVLEDWYLCLWKQWIEANAPDSKKPELLPVPDRYKDNADNVPDTLAAQLGALKGVGFTCVDCFYKHGVFAVFGGRK